MVAGDFAKILLSLDASAVDSMLLQILAQKCVKVCLCKNAGSGFTLILGVK